MNIVGFIKKCFNIFLGLCYVNYIEIFYLKYKLFITSLANDIKLLLTVTVADIVSIMDSSPLPTTVMALKKSFLFIFEVNIYSANKSLYSSLVFIDIGVITEYNSPLLSLNPSKSSFIALSSYFSLL